MAAAGAWWGERGGWGRSRSSSASPWRRGEFLPCKEFRSREVLLRNRSGLKCKQHTSSFWIAQLLFVAKPGTPRWKNCSAASRPQVLSAGVALSLVPVSWVLKADCSQQAKAVTLLHDLRPGLVGRTFPGKRSSAGRRPGSSRLVSGFFCAGQKKVGEAGENHKLVTGCAKRVQDHSEMPFTAPFLFFFIFLA